MYAVIKSLGTHDHRSKFAIDQGLQQSIKDTNKCIGIVFHKDGDNKIATLTSWKCETKKQFLCSLDVVAFTTPTAKAKLPCMPSKIRKKRSKESKGLESDLEEKGKWVNL